MILIPINTAKHDIWQEFFYDLVISNHNGS